MTFQNDKPSQTFGTPLSSEAALARLPSLVDRVRQVSCDCLACSPPAIASQTGQPRNALELALIDDEHERGFQLQGSVIDINCQKIVFLLENTGGTYGEMAKGRLTPVVRAPRRRRKDPRGRIETLEIWVGARSDHQFELP